jgi:hypothetical protein
VRERIQSTVNGTSFFGREDQSRKKQKNLKDLLQFLIEAKTTQFPTLSGDENEKRNFYSS